MIFGRWILFLLLGSSLLAGEDALPTVIDYGTIFPSCGARSPLWKTGQLAFNGAPELGSFLAYLKRVYAIDVAVETGTFRGNTTAYFSLLFDEVYTVEVDRHTYQDTAHRLKEFSNVHCLFGNSVEVLADLLPKLEGKCVLFYLDAHREGGSPLRGELLEISNTHRDNCVVVIDDFKVPGREEIPFDTYRGKECSFDYIKEPLGQLFSDCEMHYLIPANIECRAKFIVFPTRLPIRDSL